MIIYRLTSRSERKTYVGCTTRPLRARLDDHRWGAHRRRTLIAMAIVRLGWGDFEAKILEEAADREAETKWIVALGALAPSGYNLNTGGRERRGIPDVRRRQGRPGVPRSAETRAKISAAHKGRIITWRDAIAASRRGQPCSAQQADALTRGRHARWSPERRKAASLANPNRRLSAKDEAEIIELRRLGWSQQRLADRFDVSQTAISRLLRRTAA